MFMEHGLEDNNNGYNILLFTLFVWLLLDPFLLRIFEFFLFKLFELYLLSNEGLLYY